MFNSKASPRERELENLLMQRDAEVNDYRRRMDDMSRMIANYQANESNIVGALTEAQATSKRIIDEACARRDQLISEGELQKQQAGEQAEAMLNDAEQRATSMVNDADVRAQTIIENANMEARNIINQAQASYEECKQSISRMNERLALTAEEAVRRIEDFRSSFNLDSVEPEQISFQSGNAGSVVETPETYESPADLMKNIYTIQGRDIPSESGADPYIWKQEPAVSEEANTSIPSHVEEPAQYFNAPQEQVSYKPEERVSTPQYFASAPSPFTPANEQQVTDIFAPMREPMPQSAPVEYYENPNAQFVSSATLGYKPEQTYAPLTNQNEERVWTVEEVVAEAENARDVDKSAVESSIDAELEALINDVLKDN